MTVLTVNNIDKSDYITGLSSFRYEINKDFTFELPDLDIESAIDIGNINDIVKISNSTGSIDFYITEKKQDQDSLFWNYHCEHLLYKLKGIKTDAIPTPSMVENVGANFTNSYSSWSDINLLFNNPLSVSECYRRYNNFDVPTETITGPVERSRQQYYQVLFLMQMLIRKATGKGINAIDVSKVYDEDSIYHATQASATSPYWQYVTLKYKEIGIPIQFIKRMGTSNTYQFQTQPSSNFDEWDKITDCLDLLRYLCSSLMIVIDIFNNYTIRPIMTRSQSNDKVVSKDTDDLIRFRKVSGSESVLNLIDDAYNSELFVEYYVENQDYYYYTFGESGENQREMDDYSAGNVNNIYFTSETVANSFPTFFKLYQIILNTSSYYKSKLYNLRTSLSVPGTYPPDDRVMYWLHCYADALFDYWEGYNKQDDITEISADIKMTGHETEIDVENQEITYKRYYNAV